MLNQLKNNYDLKIKTPKSLNINLSIKKMLLSKKELYYKSEFRELENKYKKILQTNKINGIILIIKSSEYNHDKIYNVIKSVPKYIKQNPYFNGEIDNMEVFISKMKFDYGMSNTKLSYQFNLIIPYDDIERKRFLKK